MIELRTMTYQDYNDVAELCKDIWEGTDYLPQLFHQWVDDKAGLFIGAVDTETNKVVGTDKYSVLSDGSGWLEGIRVHKDYRGRKLAKLMAEYIMGFAIKELKAGKINKLAFSTHASAVESITMMKKLNFEIEQQHILVHKDFEKLNPSIRESDFKITPWDISYDAFVNLPFTKRRKGIFHIAFWFQKPTKDLFEYLKEHHCFVNINGYNGIYLFKGEPHFVVEDERFEAIDIFMNYYLLKLKDNYSSPPYFSVLEQDRDLIEKLKFADYSTWTDWKSDYYYFVMKER